MVDAKVLELVAQLVRLAVPEPVVREPPDLPSDHVVLVAQRFVLASEPLVPGPARHGLVLRLVRSVAVVDVELKIDACQASVIFCGEPNSR